ncbi:MAG: class I SAM-dependent methyltransferase [Candidatus Peribacteria bacterium]|nr:MAG: class I SAM-dependent methyltransferase [Candidatus Peribacteria bacterium]
MDVLEVGCGDGRLVEAISEKLEAKSFHYTGVDISQ